MPLMLKSLWRRFWRSYHKIELDCIKATMQSNALVVLATWLLPFVILGWFLEAVMFVLEAAAPVLTSLLGEFWAGAFWVVLWTPFNIVFLLVAVPWAFRWGSFFFERVFSNRVWAEARRVKLEERLRLVDEPSDSET